MVNTKILLGWLAVATLIGCESVPPTIQIQESVVANGRFQVVGSKIYNPSGSEFIIKGTNINGPKYGWPGETPGYVDLVADCWQFNTIRVNVRLFDDKRYYEANGTIEEIIDTYTAKGIVTIIEAHDRTGKYYQGQELEILKDFHRGLAIKYRDNPYVWFNVMNEPGNENSHDHVSDWLNVHQEVIHAIRDEAGADNIIVIDAHYWGQDVGEWNDQPVAPHRSAILSHGEKVIKFNNKIYDNIVFSIHIYNQWRFSQQKMADYFDRVLAKDLALIVGEYAAEKDDKSKAAVEYMFNTAVPRKIGRIVWAWWGGDVNDLTTTDNGGGQHINDCQNPTNLTWLGQLVWQDNHSD